MGIGTGYAISIAFASGFFARIRGVNRSGLSRPSLDTSHSQTINKKRTFIPGDLVDPGSYEVELLFDPDQQADPPIDSDPETCTITYPSGMTRAATAFLTDWGDEGPYDDMMTASATLKVSGEDTITAAP